MNALLLGGLFSVGAVQGISSAASQTTHKEALKQLQQEPDTFSAISEYLEQLARQEGALFAYEVMRRADLPPNTDVHLLGHTVGDVLYDQQGLAGMAHCTSDFRNACSHSIVIGTLLERGPGVLDGEVHEACSKAPGGKGAYGMCFHGFGHGVLAFTSYNPEKAIDLCKRVGTDKRNDIEFRQCVGGLTMEMTSGVHAPERWRQVKGEYLKSDDPLYFCRSDIVPEEAEGFCYSYIVPHLFEVVGVQIPNPTAAGFDRAFDYCADMPRTDPNRYQCFSEFGKEFVVLVQDHDIRDVTEITDDQLRTVYRWCREAGERKAIQGCLNSAQNSLYWGGENPPGPSVRLCSIVPDQSYRQACFEQLYDNVSYYRDDRAYYRRVCDLVPAEQRDQCERTVMPTPSQ